MSIFPQKVGEKVIGMVHERVFLLPLSELFRRELPVRTSSTYRSDTLSLLGEEGLGKGDGVDTLLSEYDTLLPVVCEIHRNFFG